MTALTLPSLESSNHLIDEFLSSGAISYAYQPVIDVVSRQVFAYEVFVRHLRGARSNILTALPMSPQHRFRLDLHGVNAVSTLLSLGHPCRYMLNIDADTFLCPNFTNEVKRVVTPERAKNILLEITSRSFIRPDNDDVAYNISSLAEYGFRVGIDSLGTKSSNLPLIGLDNVSFIKLDAWVSEGIENPRIASFATSMVEFANRSGMTVLAKDVESEDQSAMLLACGVNYQQGVYLGEPEDFKSSTLDDESAKKH